MGNRGHDYDIFIHYKTQIFIQRMRNTTFFLSIELELQSDFIHEKQNVNTFEACAQRK